MRIFLVRHGESMGNVDKAIHLTTADHAIPLSEQGKLQAEQAAVFLAAFFKKERDESWTRAGGWSRHPRMWVSPYTRARMTADPIQKAMAEERVLKDRREHLLLAEQQFGLLDGIAGENVADHYPDVDSLHGLCKSHGGRFWSRMPGGQSRYDKCVEVHQAFGTFHRDREKHGIKNIIVVAHGTTIRAFVTMWLHKPWEWFEEEPNPRNCSIRLIEDGEDKGYVFKP